MLTYVSLCTSVTCILLVCTFVLVACIGMPLVFTRKYPFGVLVMIPHEMI